jgi:hypothetical protein
LQITCGGLALIGVPVVVTRQRGLQILDALGARQSADPLLLNVGVVGIEFVSFFDPVSRAFVHRDCVAYASHSEKSVGLGISRVDDLDPLFFCLGDLALTEPDLGLSGAERG